MQKYFIILKYFIIQSVVILIMDVFLLLNMKRYFKNQEKCLEKSGLTRLSRVWYKARKY